MNENNVATNVQAQEQQQTRVMGIQEMLWKIQTQLEVEKEKPSNGKFSYFSLDKVLKAFHKVQKNIPCTLTMSDTWVFDETANPPTWLCIGKAKLTSIFDPSDFVEAEGTVMPSFAPNLGTMEQRCGSTNTYARKTAVANLFGLTEEQEDPDALTQKPTTNRGQKQTEKNTTLQSAQAQGVSAQTVPQPKTAPALVQTQAQPQTQAQAPAPEAAPAPEKTGIVFEYPGDKLTMKISTLSEPLTFPAFKEPVNPKDAMKATFQMTIPEMQSFNGEPIVQVMNDIFTAFDVQKIHLISNMIKDQTSESPANLPVDDVMTLKNISALMTVKLSKVAKQVQKI